MLTSSANVDIKSDYIDAYVVFVSPSLAASSIRLLKIDLNRFYRWYCSFTHKSSLSLDLIAEKYINEACGGDSDTVVRRKLSSINKFISWFKQSKDITNIHEAHSCNKATKSTNNNILSYKLIGILLLLFFIFLLAFATLLFTSQNSTANKKIEGLKRFVLYVPVVSTTLPQGLNEDIFKIKIFDSSDSKIPAATLICNVNKSILNSKVYIYIDSDVNCSSVDALLTDDLSSLSEYYVDIIVRSTKINGSKIHIALNQAQISASAGSQSQVSSDIFVSKQDDYVINSATQPPDYVASSESVLVTRPNEVKFIPLNIFNAVDAANGDVVTLSSNRLTKAILNTPVIGIVDEDRLVIAGKALVNISEQSDQIAVGDYLSVSIEAGTAIKASLGYDNVIGVSLESWPNDINKVNILLLNK